ncbi:MAG: biotin synthase [Ideonella sp. MAG2]|nr:MAG: biotin synthase [Ideonella sp. MAG2]
MHEELASRMAERLSFIKRQPELVLDWSPDLARPASPLVRAYPRAEIRCIREADAALLPRSWWQRLSGATPRQPWQAPSATPGAGATLLWSHMQLHLEADPLAVMRQWREALSAEGFLMFTTLGPGSLAGLRKLYEAAGWGEAHAPFTDMHDLGDMLVESGFADPVMDQETLTLHYTSPEMLLRELREMGCNLSPQRHAGLRSRSWLAQLKQALVQQADAQGRLALQWEVVYGHAFKAPDRGPTLSADTRIPLDDMKLMLRKR